MSTPDSRPAYGSFTASHRDVYQHAVRETRLAGRTGATMLLAEQDARDWSDAPTPDLVMAQAPRHSAASIFDPGAGRLRAPPLSHGRFICIAPDTATNIVIDGPHVIRVTAIPYAAVRLLAGQDDGLPSDGDFGGLQVSVHRDRDVATVLDRLWARALKAARMTRSGLMALSCNWRPAPCG